MTRLALVLVCLMVTLPALAVQPNEMLDDPVLEGRARAISKNLRCLVCQNQSIDDSDASLAHDLRVIVRERLQAGDSDAEVIAFVTDRYGDFVLLKPPVKPKTYLLWFGPALLLVAGAVFIVAKARRRARSARAGAPLSADERTRVDALLGGRDDKGSAAQ
jgi:cytochrome c-type biogenesis protein CcmH